VARAVAVDWNQYFYSIRSQCPWAWAAWQRNEIMIQRWQGKPEDLGNYQARVYIVALNRRRLKKLAKKLDTGDCEWLWSIKGYGLYATPVPTLIQQSRQRLTELRSKHNAHT